MRAGVLPGSPHFREEAVAAYLQGQEPRAVLRVAPLSSWVMFWFLACGVSLAIAMSIVGRIALTTKGRGILRVPGGAQPVVAQTSGLVAEVKAHPGARAAKGDVLVRIDSASTKAALLEADEQLRLVSLTLDRLKTRQKALYDERVSLLSTRVALLKRRIASQKATVARLEKKAQSYGELATRGYVGAVQRGDVDEELSQASRQELALQEEVGSALGSLASLDSERESELYKWAHEAEQARIKRDALRFSLDQTTVIAPEAGTLEGFLVRPGDAVQIGSVIARIVPEKAPSELVAFVPESDRAFVEEGAEVQVELDQLPAAEFGMFHARIARISRDLATPMEVGEALGGRPNADTTPSYRVDLALSDDAQSRHYARLIRPGMLVSVRYTLRRRRIITILLDPLKAWLN
jgi:multidrug resistance efflux pump